MPFKKFSEIEFYFREPRLEMSQPGRLMVRLVFYSFYVILIAADIIFLLSDVPMLFWSGVLLLIFLLDRLIHLGGAERSLHQHPAKKTNLALYLTPASFNAIEYAFERALWAGGNFYLFLIKRLADKKEILEGLARMDIKPEEFEEKIEEYLEASLQNKESAGSKKEIRQKLLQEAEKLTRFAFEQAVLAGGRFIKAQDLFAALSSAQNEQISKLFGLFDIDPGDLQLALIFGRRRWLFWRMRKIPATLGGFAQRSYFVRHRIMNRAWSARPTPILDKFSEDLTDYARLEKIGFLVGHSEEYDRMEDVLSRSGKPNILLVGEPGVGKEALVAHLAFRIVKDDVPAELFDKRLVRLDIGSLISGVEQSELQKRIKAIVEEIARAGNIILYIPEIHQLARTAGKANLSAADILLPAIRGTDFSVIGATYPREFKESIESQTDFSKAFEVVRVEELSPAEAMKLLVYQSIILEKLYKMMISFGAIKQAVNLANKYFRSHLLPGSAEDLLKEAIADAKGREDKYLTAEDVLDIAQRRVNIPLRQAKESEAEQLLNLEQLIHQRLIDQEEAVKAVSRSLREYRSGLSREGGPIASFLFVGPTGVGKTELSKILANIQFGSKEAMVRFDMSEYQDKQSIFRFIGSPDQSVSGSLTDAILQKPYSLVLLDEFEKAHPDILNLFLQVFDDGRLTDNFGRLVDFQNTVIIATSNAHSDFIKSEIENGRNMQEVGEEVKKKLSAYFKPELINRFSGIIVFKNLSPADIQAIARIQLEDLTRDLNENQGISLRFEDSAVEAIAGWGYDPVFGARPLRSVISEKVRSVLAEKLLKQEVVRGSNIVVVLEGEQLNFINQ